MSRYDRDGRDNRLAEILQLRRDDLLTKDEARDALRAIRPDLFPANPNTEGAGDPEPYKIISEREFDYIVPSGQRGGHPFTVSIFRSTAGDKSDALADLVLDALNSGRV